MKKNSFSINIFFINIFINIKKNFSNFEIVKILAHLLEFCDKLVIIDIIFNNKRNFINIHFFFYFASPLFYFEILNSYLSKDNIEMEKETYKNDQIYLIQKKYFNINPIEQYYFNSFYKLKIIILATIFLLFFVNIFIKNNKAIKYIQIVSSNIIFVIFKLFGNVLFVLFNRIFIIQFTNLYNKINITFMIRLIYLIIFNFIAFLFYTLFYYAFFDNILIYLFTNNIFLINFWMMELTSILIVFRINNNYSILYQLIWSLLFIFEYLNILKLYFHNISKNYLTNIKFFLNSFILSMFIIRFISLFYISKYNKQNVCQIFEIVSYISLVFIIFFKFYHYKNISSFVEIINNLKKEKNITFYLLNQLFYKLYIFSRIKLNSIKINEKIKYNFFFKYKKSLFDYFFKNKEDFIFFNEVISLEIFSHFFNHSENKKISSVINNNQNEDNNEFNEIIKLLLNINNHCYKIAKEKQNYFGEKCKEILIFYKILIFYIYDKKPFRTEYYIKRFLFKKNIKKSNLLFLSIFFFIDNILKSIYKVNDDNNFEYIIYFNILNIKYLKIVNSIKYIMQSFNRKREKLIKIIDKQSKIIGNNLDLILYYNELNKKKIKIKEKIENKKFELIYNLLFNNNYEDNIDLMDLNNFDTLVEKNNYFLFIYDNNDYIIKKIPFNYLILTNKNELKLYKKSIIKIFPYIIRTPQKKIIKNSLLKLNYLNEENCIFDIEEHLINVKFNYKTLPSFEGFLYIICTLEEILFPNCSNILLINIDGIIFQTGDFFYKYFGINIKNKINFLSLFNIKKINFQEKGKQTFNININKLFSNLNKYFIINGINKEKIKSIFDNLKKIYDKNEIINFDLYIKKHFCIHKNDYIYLVQINFPEINNIALQQKNNLISKIEKTIINMSNIKKTTITNSSSSSVMSKIINNEKTWNIFKKNEQNNFLPKTCIEKISFYNNICLILIAIIFSILNYQLSKTFKFRFKQAISIGEILTEFIYSCFYVSNKIRIKDYEDYDILNEDYWNLLEGYNISLSDYYKKRFSRSAEDFAIFYIYLKNNVSSFNHKSNLYKYLIKDENLLLMDGMIITLNFYRSFEILRNYFYILSQNNDFFQNITLINYDKIVETIPTLEENEKYIYSILYNSFNLFESVFLIKYSAKEYFIKERNSFKLNIIILMITNYLYISISLTILYISIFLLNNKMQNIVEKIFNLTKNKKKILEKKLSLIEKLILNEQKATYVIEKLAEMNKKFLSKSKSNNNHSIKEEINYNYKIDDNQEDTFLINFSSKKENKNHFFISFKKALIQLIFLTLIFFIGIILSFYFLHFYFDKLNLKLNQINFINDFHILIYSYYLEIRFSILLNKTEINVDDVTNYIFLNYSSLISSLINENNNELNDYLDIMNHGGTYSCDKILNQNNFKYSLMLICEYETIMQSQFDTILSGFINNLRKDFLNFYLSDRQSINIAKIYHSRSFQLNNLNLIIFFRFYFLSLEDRYIKPNFIEIIDNLISFLLALNTIMLIIQIIYYLIANFLILKNLTDSMFKFTLIKNFFSFNEKEVKK